MFINEFFFSFSILVFTGGLLILGTVLLVDAFRRLAIEWWSKSSRKKAVGDGAGNLIQQRVVMSDEEAR